MTAQEARVTHRSCLRLVLTLVTALGLSSGCRPPTAVLPAPPDPPYLADLEDQVFEAVNAERQKRDLLPLERDYTLNQVAHGHCAYMCRQERLTHKDDKNREVEGRFEEKNIPWRLAAENVARNRGFADPVQEAVRGWLASPGHRKNMLEKEYRQTGLGVVQSRKTGYYYFTQVFLRRVPD